MDSAVVDAWPVRGDEGTVFVIEDGNERFELVETRWVAGCGSGNAGTEGDWSREDEVSWVFCEAMGAAWA